MAETPRLILDGDISPLQKKLNEAKEDLRRFGATGESAFGGMMGPLSALQSKFVAIGALLAGGAVFKEAIAETVKFTEESTKLGEALGISAGQASVLREALEQGNTSQDEFVTAAKGLLKQVRENESGLNDMGLKTRDAAGQLRPLNDLTMDAIQVLNGYRAGTDRAIAGQVMFGKGFELTSNLARMTKKDIAETQAQMESLGMVASQESVAAWEEYDHSTDQANTTLKAIKTTVGNVLMPVLSTLANWFVSVGPAAVTVIRGALGGLAAMFHFVTTGVTVLWETINAMIVTVAEPIRALGEAIGRALTGDFHGAADAIKSIGGTISNAWATAFDEMAAKAQSTRDRIAAIFGAGTATGAPGAAGESAAGLIKKKGDSKKSATEKDPMDQSFLSTYEGRLAEIKNAYEQEDGLRNFSKTQELAYWRELQQSYTLTSKDRLAVAKRTATLELEIRREEVKDLRALDVIGVDAHRAAAMGQLAADEQAAQFALENGRITKAQLIEIEEEFARRKFEIEYQALLQRAELAKNDPTASPTALALLKEQMLQVEREYLLKKGELGQKKNKEGGMGGVFDDIGGAFGSGFNAILTKATTFRQQMANIFQGIYQSFVQNLITKPVGEWIASNAKMLAVKMGFIAQEKGLEAAGAAATVGIKAAETTAVAAGNAVQAGTGAAASQASIPIVGPALALAAMAAVFAAVSSLGKGKSAMGGYDIPKGLNPLTQLHEEEMVLPQKYANVIRGFAAGGQDGGDGASSDGGAVNISINTMDVKGVRDWLKSNPDALAPALRRAARNYSPRSTTSAMGKVF